MHMSSSFILSRMYDVSHVDPPFDSPSHITLGTQLLLKGRRMDLRAADRWLCARYRTMVVSPFWDLDLEDIRA